MLGGTWSSYPHAYQEEFCRPNPHPHPHPHPHPRPSKVALGNLQNKKGPVGEGGFLYDSTKPAP